MSSAIVELSNGFFENICAFTKSAIFRVSQWCLRWLKFLSVLPEVSETESQVTISRTGVRLSFCADWSQTLVETASKTDRQQNTHSGGILTEHWQTLPQAKNTGIQDRKYEHLKREVPGNVSVRELQFLTKKEDNLFRSVVHKNQLGRRPWISKLS